MKTGTHPRRFRASAGVLAGATVPFALHSAASAVVYSTTPVTVLTAAQVGANLLTVGQASTTSVNPLINQDSLVISGYANASSGSRAIYYLTPGPGGATPTVSSVSLTDANHVQTGSTPILDEVSSSGLVAGYQTRTNTGGSTYSEGTDVFTSTGTGTPTILPLPTTVLGGGAAYSYTDTSTGYTYQVMNLTAGTDATNNPGTNPIGTGGIVVGSVYRYSGDANAGTAGGAKLALGYDGFYYNPATATTTAIGLTGAGYESTAIPNTPPGSFSQTTTVTGTAGTAAAGFTARTDAAGDSLGYDSWYYTPTSGTVQIGLVGGIYTNTSSNLENSQARRTNSAGQVAGIATVNPTTSISGTGGTDLWLYTPSANPGVASGFGTSAAGTYARLGLFATPTATALGNITPSTNFRNSNLYFLSNAGTAAGNSNRVDTNGNFEGLAAWYYNGTTNVDISPALSGVHNAVAGGAVYSSNTITALNSNAGLVAGYATRIAGTTSGSGSLGQDAYVYDPSANGGQGQTIFVDPNDANMGTGNYEYSYVGVIGDNGTAIGYYNTYSGTSSTVLSSTLFDWTEPGGLQPLVTYAGSTAASYMSAYVDSFEVGADGTIYGPNTYSGATSIVAYDVASVPEPTSIGLLGMVVVPALLRRRRRA